MSSTGCCCYAHLLGRTRRPQGFRHRRRLPEPGRRGDAGRLPAQRSQADSALLPAAFRVRSTSRLLRGVRRRVRAPAPWVSGAFPASSPPPPTEADERVRDLVR